MSSPGWFQLMTWAKLPISCNKTPTGWSRGKMASSSAPSPGQPRQQGQTSSCLLTCPSAHGVALSGHSWTPFICFSHTQPLTGMWQGRGHGCSKPLLDGSGGLWCQWVCEEKPRQSTAVAPKWLPVQGWSGSIHSQRAWSLQPSAVLYTVLMGK